MRCDGEAARGSRVCGSFKCFASRLEAAVTETRDAVMHIDNSPKMYAFVLLAFIARSLARMSGRSLFTTLDCVEGLGALDLVELEHVVLETPKLAHVHLDFSDDAEVIAPLQENLDRQVSVPAAVSSLMFSLRPSSVHLERVPHTLNLVFSLIHCVCVCTFYTQENKQTMHTSLEPRQFV
jgi:hypothetical protein